MALFIIRFIIPAPSFVSFIFHYFFSRLHVSCYLAFLYSMPYLMCAGVLVPVDIRSLY